MVAQKEVRLSYFRRLRRWIKGRWIQDVPEDIAACEFECRRLECRQGDWETCENRLRSMRCHEEPAE
jgi:hypothetical protein